MPVHNNCTFVGNLGRDPELQYTPSGTAVMNVGLAVRSREKQGEDWVDGTTWVELTAFGNVAERMHQYLAKGDRIVVECEYQKRKWETSEGDTRYAHDFIVRDFTFGSRKERSETAERVVVEEEEEALPF